MLGSRLARLTITLTIFARLARRFRTAGNLIRRAAEAAQHLAQRLDLAFVGGLLALCLLDQFQQFIQRLGGVAQGSEHGLSFLHGLPDGRGRRWLGGRRQRSGLRPRLAAFGLGPRFVARGRRRFAVRLIK